MRTVAATILAFSAAVSAAAQVAARYRATEVGFFGFVGPNEVEAINSHGVVVGSNLVERRVYSGGVEYITRGYVCDEGISTQLPSVPDGDYSWARDINDDGVIVGQARQPDDEFVGCLLSPTEPARPIELAGGRAISANAINENGLVVGGAQRDDGRLCPYAHELDGGGTHFIEIPGERGAAVAVNDSGVMVGRYFTAEGLGRPFRGLPGQPAVDLNSLLPTHSPWVIDYALDVNNHGVIVGTGLYLGEVRSYRGTFDGTDPELLPPLPGDTESRVAAINDDGLAVGLSYYFNRPAARWTGVVWTADEVININDRVVDRPAGLWFEGVRDLNHGGSLVARGAQGAVRQYVLTPICEGDFDGNSVVDLSDLAALLQCFAAGPCGDVDGDGDTDLQDLATLLAWFGRSC